MYGKEHGTSGSRYHQQVYLCLLVFVAVAGLPIVGIPSLRHCLHDRVETLRLAAKGMPVPQVAMEKVGGNSLKFPKEYERVQMARPSILPKFEMPLQRTFSIKAGGGSNAVPEVLAPVPHKIEDVPVRSAPEPAAGTSQAAAGTGTEYRKGAGEKEAFDILINANLTLAGMINGSDPAIRFQDWSAAALGQDSYNVSVSFLQTTDNGVRKYIWNVKVQTKEITPLSAYAREISK